MAILKELGYAPSDFELWEGWLIFEESSAERIIREFLIPMFAPKLSKYRTLAANGIDEVEPTFNDFFRLVRFNHLEEIYRQSTWVRVDGDEIGTTTVERLQSSYSGWDKERFGCFSLPQFEHYYPYHFKNEVIQALGISNKAERRAAKRNLLLNVLQWLNEDDSRARQALEESASEVIAFLRLVETTT
jgi:hypothetical protein